MDAEGFERRSGVRRSSPGSVINVAPVMDEARKFFGHAQNISRSGMLIHTHMPIGEGDELELEFTLPGTETVIKCRAKVRWASGFTRGETKVSRGGLEFLDLDAVFADRIGRWANGESI
jgi:PilZ domain